MMLRTRVFLLLHCLNWRELSRAAVLLPLSPVWMLTALCVVLTASGCQTTPLPGMVSCPLPVTEQVASILEVVPLGTSREDATKLLRAAGVQGTFNDTRTIFYCDLWDRGEGPRWHINVALLFDEDGQLIGTRPDSNGALVNPARLPITDDPAGRVSAGDLYAPFE